jgi:signal transduction histidine kinase
MGQPEEIAVPYMNSLRKAFETGQQVEHFNSFPTPAGELYFFSRIIPEKNKKGSVETVLGIARDITEIKRAELELKEKENHVAELNKSLVSMNKELISANSELKAFTGIAATNYSETLRHLYINLELIVTNDARNLSNSGRANLRRAQGAIQKMKLLTDDLVSFSKLHDIGSKEEHVDLNKILHATVNDFTSKITHPLVEINCDQLPTISGYPLLLSLLFTHLIDNAIKFRRQDKGHVIHISCREAVNGSELNIEGGEKKASYHIITISDNGIGFPQAESGKIFEMFYRLHEQGKFKGSGIGLAVCKKVMEMHDGFITAEGIPDQGAIFHCYFPA